MDHPIRRTLHLEAPKVQRHSHASQSRFRNPTAARVYDFFAGRGGTSRGLQAAGTEITFALDNNVNAEASFEANFPHAHFECADVRPPRRTQSLPAQSGTMTHRIRQPRDTRPAPPDWEEEYRRICAEAQAMANERGEMFLVCPGKTHGTFRVEEYDQTKWHEDERVEAVWPKHGYT